MTNIRVINEEIEKLQAEAEAEGQEAQREREKAEAYRGDGNINQMQGHQTAGAMHDRKALERENRINTLTAELTQLQRQAEKYREERARAEQTYTQEMARYDGLISQITGE